MPELNQTKIKRANCHPERSRRGALAEGHASLPALAWANAEAGGDYAQHDLISLVCNPINWDVLPCDVYLYHRSVFSADHFDFGSK